MLCVDSVSKAIEGINAEIIVIDNNSEDKSCELVNTFYPDVQVIRNSENVGFSKANNAGVKVSKGEYLCILNPDTVVPEDCFKNLFSYYDKLENPGAIGVQLVDGAGGFLQESKRNIPTPKIALQKLVGNSSSYYNHDLDKDENGPTDILVGAFLFLKSEVYQKIGGFDEDYFMYGEDIDFSYRISKLGFQNYYLGTTKVLHFKGESTTKDQVYLNRFFNAMFIFYKKHFKNYKFSYALVKQSLKFTIALESLRLKQIKVQNKTFKTIYLLSHNKCLVNKVKSRFGAKTKVLSSLNSEINGSLIVLDADYIGYKSCIESLTKLKGKNNSFRIKPIHHKFMIGSESKYLKGEVIDLS